MESCSNNKNEALLELKLGPPRDEDWSSFSYFSSQKQTKKPVFVNQFSPLQNLSAAAAVTKESSQLCCTKEIPLPSISQKRTAPAPVVGWPPIRSFRKNLASTSSASKLSNPNSPDMVNKNIPNDQNPVQTITKKGMFVKINMDGVPIGRKVDLSAYGSYEKLSSAVDILFRDLLAAQRDSSAGGIMNTAEEEKAITGVLDGSGEYTLVYEDNEGDRMLVGDVPWHMFVSTVKRLRVLKSSEVSALNLGNGKQERSTNA
jgi:auxin-responsive protein IAA